MKGIELPINVLIIVAVALVVLLGLIAIYFSGFGPFTGAMTLESAKNEACRELVQERRCNTNTNNIAIDGFDADGDGTEDSGTTWNWAAPSCSIYTDNLASLCYCVYKFTQETQCKQMCGCP